MKREITGKREMKELGGYKELSDLQRNLLKQCRDITTPGWNAATCTLTHNTAGILGNRLQGSRAENSRWILLAAHGV
jgi:hypothetical protein